MTEPPVIEELQFVGFELSERETDTEYAVRVGDIPVGTGLDIDEEQQEQAVGHLLGDHVLWGDGPHLESGRGRLRIRLLSRRIGLETQWRSRAECVVYVLPTKLGDRRYRTMFDELRALAVGLVFDLVSKAVRSIGYGATFSGISVRSSHLELRAMENLWTALGPALANVAREPVQSLQLVREAQPCWGSERLSHRSLARLVAAGVDPRRRGQSRPFPAIRERLVESNNTVEHRIILAFFHLLRDRVKDCVLSIERHMKAIEAERPMRDRRMGTEPSLYESQDRPRIRQLLVARGRAAKLAQHIRRVEQMPLLRGLAPLVRLPRTPVFDHVAAYRLLQGEMLRYLRSSLLLLDEDGEERIKSTSRMYEQWVLLQVAEALRQAGMRCEGFQGLLRRATTHRFTLDIDRNTRLLFHTGDGRVISVRYEPWILPAELARERGDSVYRGRAGDTAWSPDILVEVLRDRGARERPPDVEYAIVIDAKYSRRIEPRHWAHTDKYLQIRSTRTDRQAVKQVWLAYPSDEVTVTCRDPAVRWTDQGPSCPREETVQGTLGFLPPEAPLGDGGTASEARGTTRVFIDGLLRYLGLRPSVPDRRRVRDEDPAVI